jgi:hypothetical protein
MKGCSIKNDVHAAKVFIGTPPATPAEAQAMLWSMHNHNYIIFQVALGPQLDHCTFRRVLSDTLRNQIETCCVTR